MKTVNKKALFLFLIISIILFIIIYFLLPKENIINPASAVIKKDLEEAPKTVLKYLKYNVPVISITTDPDNLYDEDIGIFVEGSMRKEWWELHKGEKPDGTTIFLAPANFWQKGKEWERPMYIEVYDPLLGKVISQDAGMRIHGGWSRGNEKQKSVRIFARKMYDENKYRFKYDFFPNLTLKNNDAKLLRSFKRLVLRNGGNDYWETRIRDEVMQDIAAQTGLDTQASRVAIFILNDKFYGITQVKQTYDRYYIKDNYGAKEENVVILEMANTSSMRVIDGEQTDADDYHELQKFIAKSGKKNEQDEIKARIEAELDVEQTLLYYAFQIYIGNGDWPHNNVRVWRYNNGNPMDKKGKLDGKWRYFLFDTDFGLGLYGDYKVDMLSQCLDSKGDGGVFYGLMKIDDYRLRFIEIMYDLMDNYFTKENTDRVIALRQLEIAPVIGLSFDNLNWDGTVQKMRRFIANRNEQIEKQLIKRLGDEIPGNTKRREKITSSENHIYDYMKNRILIRGTLSDESVKVIKVDGEYYVPISVLSGLGAGSLDSIRKQLTKNAVTVQDPETEKKGQYVKLSSLLIYDEINVTYLEDINSLVVSKK